jgi:hypothetical protein
MSQLLFSYVVAQKNEVAGDGNDMSSGMVISALGRLRQEDRKVQTSLGYLVRL